jgi:hypothetical protein
MGSIKNNMLRDVERSKQAESEDGDLGNSQVV